MDRYDKFNKSINVALPLLISLVRTFIKIPTGKQIIEPHEFSTIIEWYQLLTFERDVVTIDHDWEVCEEAIEHVKESSSLLLEKMIGDKKP